MGDRYEERTSRFDGAIVWTLSMPEGTVHPVLPRPARAPRSLRTHPVEQWQVNGPAPRRSIRT
ncbi:hypothetical protein ACWCPY_10730, partial [Streptomyces sp. NPDC002403]